MSQTRRLAAILAADVAGYSRLIGADEEGTLERLKSLRRELIDPKIAEHHGRIVKTTGDGLLVEFASVVDAVRCAVAVQQAMPERNTGVAADNRIELRIGINLGDVIVEDGDIYGDGVNIAARIEALADAGGVFVSNTRPRPCARAAALRLRGSGRAAGQEHCPAGAGLPGSRRRHRVRADAKRAAAGELPALPLPDKPSIAVLPFANMSGDPEQEYFVDGMVEEIITALSRIRWLFVIARNSSFTYKGQAVDVKQVGRELGVRYVLEGSVRKAGGRVRITAQLIDAVTGTHLWADRFDGSLEDVFELQDKVAISVAGVIEPALQAAETARSAGRPTNDLTAYDLYLRAYAMVLSSARQIPEALRLMEQAIARDPHYGPALAWAAFCCHRLLIDGAERRSGGGPSEGRRFRKASPGSGRRRSGHPGECRLRAGLFRRGHRRHDGVGRSCPGAQSELSRAAGTSAAFSGLWAGQPDHRDRACRSRAAPQSPRPRRRVSLLIIGRAHFFSRRFDEAVPKLLLAIQEDPSFPQPYRILAACYAHMGRLDEAREIVERLRAITPVVIPDASYLRNAEHRELFLSGLRLAAGEAA